MPDPRTSAAVNPPEVTVVVPTRNAARTLIEGGKHQLRGFHRLWHAATYGFMILRTPQHDERTLAGPGIAFLAPSHAGGVTFSDGSGMSRLGPSTHSGWSPIIDSVVDDSYPLSQLVDPVPDMARSSRLLSGHAGSCVSTGVRGGW